MAAIAFDPMEFIQQLEATGIPRSQAEAVVKVYTAMFVHNFDALVTKDYLDTRFSEFESRVDLRFVEADSKIKDLESRIDLRLAGLESTMDLRFIETDKKIMGLESRMDLRFVETDTKITDLESRMDLRFAELRSDMGIGFARLNVVMGIVVITAAIPTLQTVLTWIR